MAMTPVKACDELRFRAFVDDVRLILLTPHGRAGSLFVHGLLDGHPEILSLPFFVNRYVTDFDRPQLVDRVQAFLDANQSLFFAVAHLKIKSEQFRDLDRPTIEHLMVALLAGHTEPVEPKQLLCALFCSAALARGEDFSTYRYIAVHLHLYDGGSHLNRICHSVLQHERILADFPGGIYFALTLPPILSLASYLRERCDLYSLRYHLVYLKSCFHALTRLIRQHPEYDIRPIDIDDINSSNGEALNRVLYEVGVKPDSGLGRCTFSGVAWGGASTLNAVLLTFNPDSRAQKIAYVNKQPADSKYAQYLAFGARFLSLPYYTDEPVHCPPLRYMLLLKHMAAESLVKWRSSQISLRGMRDFAKSAGLAMTDVIYLMRRLP